MGMNLPLRLSTNTMDAPGSQNSTSTTTRTPRQRKKLCGNYATTLSQPGNVRVRPRLSGSWREFTSYPHYIVLDFEAFFLSMNQQQPGDLTYISEHVPVLLFTIV